MLVAVAACVLIAIVLYVLVTVQAIQLPGHVGVFLQTAAEERGELYSNVVAGVASILDGYLFATIMLIFAMGLYELFINKIAVAENDELARRILLIRSIDDLKDRLAKVIFLVLIVKFFEYAVRQSYTTPLELLQLAVAIALIAGALWLTSRSSHA